MEATTMELLANLSLTELITYQWINNVSRYLLVAGLSYLILWKWGFDYFKNRFLYSERPKKKDLQREFKYSVLSTAIFLIPTLIIVSAKELHLFQVYSKIGDRGLSWYLISFVFFNRFWSFLTPPSRRKKKG